MALDLQESTARQYRMVAKQPFTHDDLTVGEATDAIIVPSNSIIIGGGVIVTEAFADGTDDNQTLDVGDADTADRYGAGLALTSLGFVDITPTGHKNVSIKKVQITLSGTAPTSGEGLLVVEYMIDGRSHEVQPNTV